MSSPRWEDDFSDSPAGDEWEVAVDRRKISRLVRKERKAAEAQAAASAQVGDEPDEFDAEAARRHAAASFYGDGKKKKKQQSRNRPTDDFDEAGWTGGNGGPNAKAKKSKKPKAIVPQYNTSDEIAEALAEIIAHLPPTANGVTTIASLGDKLQTLTKAAWNKKYKSEFGSMKKFLEGRSDLFIVDGDEVRVTGNGSSAGSKAKKPKKSTKATSNYSSSNSSSNSSDNSQQNEDEGDEEDDESDENESRPASPKKSSTGPKASKKSSSSSSGGCGVTTILSLVVLTAAGAGLAYYTQILK